MENKKEDDSAIELLSSGENTWNHRVIKTTDEFGDYYAIHEVHYSNGVPHSATVEPITVGGDSVEDIKWVLEKMMFAATKDVIPMKYFDDLVPTEEEEAALDRIAEEEEKEEKHQGPDLGGC